MIKYDKEDINRKDWKIISLYTISKCNLSCAECIMAEAMKKYNNYQMTLQEIENLIYFSELSNYKFDIILSGGEPTLWDNLLNGVKLLKKSNITKSITIFSNVINLKNINDELVNYIDSIRISEYDYNKKNINIVLEKYPSKIKVVNREYFWENPKHPIFESLPAECLNREYMFYNNRVYACPHSISLSIKAKSNIKISTELKINFINDLPLIKKGQEREICTFCISNQKVRDKMNLIKNLNN